MADAIVPEPKEVTDPDEKGQGVVQDPGSPDRDPGSKPEPGEDAKEQMEKANK